MKIKENASKTALLIPFMLMVGFGNAQDSIQTEQQNQQNEIAENPHKEMIRSPVCKTGELGEHPRLIRACR